MKKAKPVESSTVGEKKLIITMDGLVRNIVLDIAFVLPTQEKDLKNKDFFEVTIKREDYKRKKQS